MLEIYNEKIQDLLIHPSKRPINGLEVRESKELGVYINGITKCKVRGAFTLKSPRHLHQLDKSLILPSLHWKVSSVWGKL